jgi:hypothetical protein
MRRLALALLCLPTVALAQDGFRPSGLYVFVTNARENGRPVCSELWEFDADGRTLRIESGAERVTETYRIETEGSDSILVGRIETTNGRADCTGNVNAAPSHDEKRIHLLPMNDGAVLTCPVPERTANGVPFVSGCYGRLIPADQVG